MYSLLFAIQIESDNYKTVLFIEPQFDFQLPRHSLTLSSPGCFGCLGPGGGGWGVVVMGGVWWWGGEVPAAHISQTIKHIGMKPGGLAENYKLII